jgi:hypothetical protein
MPAPFTDINLQYPQNPWASVETKERQPWYFPELYRVFARQAIYNRFVTQEFNFNGPRATELVISSSLMPHANHDPIGLRQAWLDSSYMDTFNRRIRFSRYAGKMSYNRYDDKITFFQKDGVAGLSRIINEGFGHMMSHQMDKQARDAFFRSPYAYFKADGSGSNFASITTSDKATANLLQDIQLGLQTRDNPLGAYEEGGFPEVICVTSPGVIYDLRREQSTSTNKATFIDVNQYSNPQRIIAGELGTYYGTRFVASNSAMLPNVGTIDTQSTITAPVNVGDGAPDPETTAVDGVEFVGQPNATHYITVADSDGFDVGDYVSIHALRTNAFGVTNGADYRDGKFMSLRIVAKSGNNLTFERPIMEPFTTNLGSGVYGYVTKATHIHTMLFLYGGDGVVRGVSQPPIVHNPKPFDDLEMFYRVTWDGYYGYTPFNKNAFEVAYVAGSHRLIGPTYTR